MKSLLPPQNFQSCSKDVRLPVQLQRAMAAEVRKDFSYRFSINPFVSEYLSLIISNAIRLKHHEKHERKLLHRRASRRHHARWGKLRRLLATRQPHFSSDISRWLSQQLWTRTFQDENLFSISLRHWTQYQLKRTQPLCSLCPLTWWRSLWGKRNNWRAPLTWWRLLLSLFSQLIAKTQPKN